jgi:hypothetical protein
MAPLIKHICAKGRLESFLIQRKYAAQLSTLIQAIWLKGTSGTYVSKKLMFQVAFANVKNR